MTDDHELYMSCIIYGRGPSRGHVQIVLKDEFGNHEKRNSFTHEELYKSMDDRNYQLFRVKSDIYVPVGFQNQREDQ